MTTNVTIHERILQQVESTELQRSSNSILKEEIVALRQGVDELVATFAKVEEVRDAVKQLEQGKASNGRSVGLTEVMNSVLELQRQLEEALEKTTTGMTMVRRSEETEKQVRGKRTREVSSSSDSSSSSESSSSSSSSSDEEEEEVKPKRKKQTNSDVEAEKEPELEKLSSDDGMALKTGDPCLQLARACLKTILNVKTVDNRIQPDMKTSWTKALRNIQQILKQQGRSGAATADNAAARMTAHALDSVVSVLKKIDWNTELVKEVHPLLEAFANACCSNETLTSYFVRYELH
ncbi:hypothetical protein PHMEG_0006914 [Phytophthora megakarya]|uniref:Uncharacterized protein n=1 Tax=Phytophthora megakarya TaxID=4795 RepID=A0A225WMP7_9STRA|nr:hypothetical protein PHMEG_0006914 [Phytophthora megakarya]